MSEYDTIFAYHNELYAKLTQKQQVGSDEVQNLINWIINASHTITHVEDRQELRSMSRFWASYLSSLGEDLPDIDIDTLDRRPANLVMNTVRAQRLDMHGDTYSADHVNLQLPTLQALAKQLHAKVETAPPVVPPVALVFVGAGPSNAANLPLGAELKNILFNAFASNDPSNAKIHELLAAELDAWKGGHAIFNKISLFEFVAIISRFAYGRQVIRNTISERLNNPSHMPLSYELLAHLAKHRYVDHFIIINFDRLLDQALLDELPERSHVVASPQDIPPLASRTGEECFAVHPFGILGEGSYSLTPTDVARFGVDPIRAFIEETLLRPMASNRSQPVLLLLVGYRAEEPAFSRFLQAQQDRWIRLYRQKRQIDIFLIDPDPNAGQTLRNLYSDIVSSVHHIVLSADDALELLLDLLYLEWKSSGHPVWIPTARHKIISKLFSYRQLISKDERFKIELLLQGLKSRGFVHLEAFGHIPRLRNYGSYRSAEAIRELIEQEVLTRDQWLEPVRTRQYCVPNFMIEDRDRVIKVFINLSRERGVRIIDEWHVVKNGPSVQAKLSQVFPEDFLATEIENIQRAPEIEIVRDAAPEVPWILGAEGKALLTIDELTRKTRSMLETALGTQGSGLIKIWGIWSTGEWLFHEDGWAHGLGDQLLGREDVELHILITQAGGVTGDRPRRRKVICKKLLSPARATVELRWLNWWELNRILTLVQSKNGDCHAVYMRRRLSAPLVCPYFIDCNAEHTLGYLLELWEDYWDRGTPVEMGDPNDSSMADSERAKNKGYQGERP